MAECACDECDCELDVSRSGMTVCVFCSVDYHRAEREEDVRFNKSQRSQGTVGEA